MNIQDQSANRKRPAPGTSPMPQPQVTMPQTYPYQQQVSTTTPDFSNYDFSADTSYSDPSSFNNNNFSFNLNSSQPQSYDGSLAPAPSTELVRRSRNQQLAIPANGQQEQWNDFGDWNSPMEEEDEADLDLKAALAKKDAQSKRKQIKPFVQKLSSFLDSNNTDLIRWSDDGRSFIVSDEDEFARTLIPELFKHSNYASFVRQLNMYGFHKTVNITDGSLRQSEKARKGVKPPSMYSHPYFRKNRPDLLWLIQKPAGSKTTKRKRDGGLKDDDSDDGSPVPEGVPNSLAAANTSQDLTQLPRNELTAVRKELQNLQTQQRFISQMITQLKEQNDQFYRQATAFQALHDRHENSINAILTFLATFYNRSLEGHGAQNLVNMFTNAMPQPHVPQQGSVVEEYDGNATPTAPEAGNQVQRFVKRPPLLLPGPAANTPQSLQPGSAVTEPSSARASATPPNEHKHSVSSVPPDSAKPISNATSPAMASDAATPTFPAAESNDQMMNLINNVNANTTAASTPNTTATDGGAGQVDMNSIVDRLTSTSNPLTPQQRDDMVASLSSNNPDAASALTAYNTSANPAEFKSRIDQSQTTLDYLQQLQKQQDARVQELNRRLQPLSPTGTIPGLHDFSNQDPFDSLSLTGAEGYDPNAWINFDDGGLEGGGDFDFGAFGDGQFDGAAGDGAEMFGTDDAGLNAGDHTTADGNGDGAGGRVESVSSASTSPAAAATEEDANEGTGRKRLRRS